MNKNVLFVSYHFPPATAVGALRTQKFVKYLPGHGWKPFVLTVKERHYPSIDKARLEDVGEAVVERTSFWRTPLQILIDLRDGLRTNQKTPLESTPSDGDKPGMFTTPRSSGLKRWLVCLNWFLDDKLYWLFPALYKGMALIRAHDIRCIVVSAPPHSSILIAYLLSRLSGAKLIIDFRDPWLLRHGCSPDAFKPQKLLDVEFKLQTHILRHAAAIVTTNDFFRSALLNEHDFLSPDSVHVVQNGFDSSDFSFCKKNEQSNKYVISYYVSYYRSKMPSDFLTAFVYFLANNKLIKDDFLVRFVGVCREDWLFPVKRIIKDNKLENIVDVIGSVSYNKSLSLMCESDLLVLPAQNSPCQIPAKAYEYLGSGRPILAIAEFMTATRSLIEQAQAGICVEPNDCDSMCEALECFYDDYSSGRCIYTYDSSGYERRYQATVLSSILDRIDA